MVSGWARNNRFIADVVGIAIPEREKIFLGALCTKQEKCGIMVYVNVQNSLQLATGLNLTLIWSNLLWVVKHASMTQHL